MSRRHESTDGLIDWRPPVTLLALLLCLLLPLAASACGPKPLAKATGGTPKRGGTFSVALGEPATLDPAIEWVFEGVVIEHTLYETLYDYAPAAGTEGEKLEPVLAAAMPTVSTDGLTYAIPLRKGVRFAPPVNRELTADDVRYSFERMLRTPQAPGTSFYDNIVGVPAFIAGKGSHVAGFRVADPYTIQIRLAKPDPTLLYTLAMEFCDVMPREWVKKWGDKIGRHPLGSGPFMLESWTSGIAVLVKRNPNYRDAAHVWLDAIKFEVAYEQERELLRVERGQIDCSSLAQGAWLQVKDNPQFKNGVTIAPSVGMGYLVLNTQMKPFDDVRVRQALNWAIDREKLARIDGNKPLYQIYPPGMPDNDPKAKFYGYDPAKARALLAAAGYPNGFATTLYDAPGEWSSKWAQLVQSDLKAVGVRAKVELVPDQLYYVQQSTPHTYPLSYGGWAMDYPDPYDWVHPLFSRALALQGGSNWSFWWDPKLEAMVAEAQNMRDPAARLAKFGEMQTYISEQAPIVPTESFVWATLTGPHVGGYYVHPVYLIDAAHYWHM
jgi:peptide/nickel transport system substrate-binding protein